MRMPLTSLLDRYLLKHTTYILFIILFIGLGVYILVDFFEKMDNFVEANLEAKYILLYFVYKFPGILGQILPAAFLFAVIIVLSLMARNRELIALYAGGISIWKMVAFFTCYALFWSGAQLVISQNLAAVGNAKAVGLWEGYISGKGKNKKNSNYIIKNLYFLDKNKIIYLERVDTKVNEGTGFVAYELSPEDFGLKKIIEAPLYEVAGKSLKLKNATAYDVSKYSETKSAEMDFTIDYKVKELKVFENDSKRPEYSLWQLWDSIKRLKKSGTNVEFLKTSLYMKIAYAASLLVMAFIAMALITCSENIYLNTSLGLLISFLFYTTLNIAGGLGEKGQLSPVLAAWGPLVLVISIALARIVKVTPPRFGLIGKMHKMK